MLFRVEIEREHDGRWIAEVPELPGVLAYGQTSAEAEAKARVQALALRVVADRSSMGKPAPIFSTSPSALRERLAEQSRPKGARCALASGWRVKRQSGSHRVLARDGWPDFVFAFHDADEIGPSVLARIARHTGLTPGDL